MNITYDTIRGSRIVTAKDQGALILRTGTVYDGIGREASHDLDLLLDGGKIVQVAPRGSFDGKGLPRVGLLRQVRDARPDRGAPSYVRHAHAGALPPLF